MQDMQALPAKHFAGLDVAIHELNHVLSPEPMFTPASYGPHAAG